MEFKVKKLNDFTWTVEKQGNMKVPAVIYSSDKLIKNILQDKTIPQIVNVAQLRGIVKHALAMPDAHEGYGFPIGGVAAFDVDEGIISPGGVGYDINCGVRLLRTSLDYSFMSKDNNVKKIVDEIFKRVPAGIGSAGMRVSVDETKEILEKGSKWALKNGYATKHDLETTEENGCMKTADPSLVSQRAIARGRKQVGSLGSGNHFLEIQRVAEIYDEETAKAFGLHKDQITVMIHCGSRGLGHQIASDYIELFEKKFGIAGLPDRELINAPFNSEEGQKYFKAMSAGVNFAFVNRQLIPHNVRQAFNDIFSADVEQVYGICHNVAKVEKHNVDGSTKKLVVHRKGATRSFGPGREEIPEIYRWVGQPVLIPGSMGTASYVLVGTKKAEEVSFGSTAHGAGRLMSRKQAIHSFTGEEISEELKRRGIYIHGISMRGIAEEAPEVYKDVDEVVRISDKLGIGKVVAKLVPLGVIKG